MKPTFIASLLAATAVSAQNADRVPIEAFYGHPAVRSVSISPDGNHIAYIAPMNGRLGVALQPVTSDKAEVLVRSANADIEVYYWKGSNHIIYGGDEDGTESYAFRSISLDKRRVQNLNQLARSAGRNVVGGGIVSGLPLDDEHVILVQYGSEGAGYYRRSVRTGSETPVRGYREAVNDTVFDHDGMLRVRTLVDDGKSLVQMRDAASPEFRTVHESKADAFVAPYAPVAFLADNTTLYGTVVNQEHDRGALVRLDPASGAVLETVFVPEEGEIQELVFSNDRTRLLGVGVEAVKSSRVWFDPTFRTLQATLDKLIPGNVNLISNWSDDQKRIVVTSYSDVQPSVYFLFDLSGPRPRLMPIGNSMPAIEPAAMRPMEPIVYEARDGLRIHGYLTRPKGATGPMPLVIMPHGGPFGVRDSWSFDPDTQFLASRGFAVLRVNFRGSSGYGLRFLEAGRFEWGGRLQDDLTDAVRWAISEGVADPKRIVWLGGSYGGYAALAAGVFTPELVTAVVNIVGVTDLTMIKRLGGDRRTAYIFAENWLGTDRALLNQRSIMPHVANLRAPSLHAYGLNDPRVEIDHWNKLESALKRAGATYESIVERNEGHGFRNPEARIALYKRIESFLEKHL